MLSFLMWSFSKQPHVANILGLRLTRDAAQNLGKSCLALERLLAQLTTDISNLTEPRDQSVHYRVSGIQDRHKRVQQQLGELVHAVRWSNEPWVEEFADANTAMQRKVKMCNHASKPFAEGWRAAALQYWPRIAQTYELLIDLLGKLRGEVEDALADAELWSGKRVNRLQKSGGLLEYRRATGQGEGAKTAEPRKRTSFDSRVKVRDIPPRDAVHNTAAEGVPSSRHVDTITLLTSERKSTAGKLKSKKRPLDIPKSEMDELEDPEADFNNNMRVGGVSVKL